jgi:hypothetical protein
MDTEKRKFQRQFLDIRVRVGDTYGQSKNVSMGGMSCTTTKEVPTLEEIDIIIYINEEDAIKLTGTALRCTPVTKDFFDVGIYFNTPNMNQETRQKLADFLGVILPKPY